MKTKKILVDTNVIIDFLKGHQEAVSLFNTLSQKITLLISTITVTELYSGVKTQEEEMVIQSFLQNFTIIAVDHDIAKRGGIIKQEYHPSHGIGIADAVIAATALANDAKLITLNVKHFPMVKSKEAPY